MPELDLTAWLGQADRDLLVQAVQALHAQRVAAWHSQNAHANLVGQVALNPGAFGIDEAAAMLRRIGAAPSVV